MLQSIEEDFKSNNAISVFDIYDHAQQKKTFPRGHEIYKCGKPFFGYHNYILTLSLLKTFLNNHGFLLYNFYGHALAQESMPRGS